MNQASHLPTTLTVPNDVGYLPVVLEYVRGIAKLAGLTTKDSEHVEVATEETVMNVLHHAFGPEEHTTFEIGCEIQPTALVVSVRDRGRPFDAAHLPGYHPDADLSHAEVPGLGTTLMKAMVDGVEFCNLGARGKEVRMIKLRPAASVLPDSSSVAPTRPLEPAPSIEELGELELRPMRPEEAIEVSRCFFEAYGYSYVYEDVYCPERLVTLNQSGRLFSAVAVSRDGEIVSHLALQFSPQLP